MNYFSFLMGVYYRRRGGPPGKVYMVKAAEGPWYDQTVTLELLIAFSGERAQLVVDDDTLAREFECVTPRVSWEVAPHMLAGHCLRSVPPNSLAEEDGA